MRRILIAIALGMALFSLTSCGLPGAVVRSTGNLIQGLDNFANSMN